MQNNIILSPSVANSLDLRALVNVDKLQRIQDEFAADTGLAMITVDAMGVPVTQASQFSTLCQFLRRDPEIRKQCYSCDAHGGLQSAIEGRPVVYQCHAGLVDFSVSIVWGQQYLGAVLCGQVLLDNGQEALRQIMARSDLSQAGEHIMKLFDQVKVVDVGRLQQAANEVVQLANESLGSRLSTIDRAETGIWLGRLPSFTDPASNEVLAPLLAGRSKALPLIPIQPEAAPSKRLDATEIARNIQQANVAANLELLGSYLDGLFPRWSQKVKRADLAEFEDLLIGLATSEAVQFGRDISQTVIRHRNQRRSPMNRYECQVYCERLLIQLHNLLEPRLERTDRNIASLLNEIEKNPTSFLTLRKAADYLMVSESHLSRKFKERTGQSFISYVTGKRLERAKLMLAHTSKPVLRIAAELDFRPHNYFSRAFKQQVGVTPSEYRRTQMAVHHG
ncbi:MAG: PocR ligand-binding domain-containing protein [Propionibacteriaceae bacterium]|nr:PocR ligand-binding domain-containing protein [Propionibacteriaceae bacterium]